MDKIIGIDLGTTNSVVAVVENGRPKIIPGENGERLLPSVVGLSPTHEILVGQPAKNQYVAEPENTIRSIKRKMGSPDRVRMGDREYLPQEISAFILRELKRRAEKYLGGPVERAVITVPAYFTDAQRQATKDAGEIAGLEVVRIINEPTAAALAYHLDQEDDFYALVYDLGGGTFDVSVIEANSGVIEVRASSGNNHLGGDDFDERIVAHLVDEFKEQHKVDLREDRKALARVALAAEEAKIRLSFEPYAEIKEEYLIKRALRSALHLNRELVREEMEAWIEDLVKSTLEPVDVALKDAGMEPQDLDRVLLVGGSTRMPMVARLVRERLKQEPRAEVNPDECVALGAAVQGAIIAGEDIDAVLVDIAPYSLGIEVVEYRHGTLIQDVYSVLIPRNTAIPTSRTERYSTVYPGQDSVHIKVYQGESRTASKNTLLDDFTLENLPAKPNQLTEVLVNFNYDINGIVQVTARCRESGQEKSITVKAARERLSDEDIEAAREALEATTREGNYEEHEALLSQARARLEKIQDEELRGDLQDVIDDLVEAIRRDDQAEADELKEELVEVMYEAEE